MAFWTPAALGPLAQSESSGNAGLIHYPTGFTPSGVRSSASGLYGYLDSTWQTYAAQAGVDTTLYPRAYMAPASVQNQVALITPVSNWTCPGCNATASRLAQDPANVSGSASTIATGPPDQASGGNPNTSDPTGSSVTMNPNGTSPTTSSGTGGAQGTPIQTGLQPEEVSQIGSWITGVETAFGGGLTKTITAAEAAVGTYLGGLQNWFTRAGLIVLGIVLIALALVFIMWDHGGKQTVVNLGKAAAA